jgi:hypothetical protein
MRDDFGRLFSGIPRETAPEIPLERLLRGAAAARGRAVALMVLGILALAGLAIGLTRDRTEAAVHLDLRVIEITAPAEDGLRPERTQPEEFDRP